MAKKKIRDNSYWLKRLQKEHPAIHKELLAGKYKSVKAARLAAGLVRQRTLLDDLQRGWNKAATTEQDKFLTWVGASRVKTSTVSSGAIADSDRRLTEDVRTFLKIWIFDNGSNPGRIMKEIGFTHNDTSLSAGMSGHPVRQEIIDALKPWLKKNGFR